ncbi:MAG: hypothetical protein LBF37_01120 [Rickettsiales bacterium]|jgi:hypothetical protein|nr:hypothetical protein [Rickettsiales bacterium]
MQDKYFHLNDELTNLINPDPKTDNLIAELRKKRDGVKSTDQTHRAINSWDAADLLDDERPITGQGWRKFSIVELFWIKIIANLREFGLSVEKIKKTKSILFRPVEIPSELKPRHRKLRVNVIEWALIRTIAISKGGNTYLLVESDGDADIMTPREFAMNSLTELIPEMYLYLNLNKLARQILGDQIKLWPDKIFYLDETEMELLKSIRIENSDHVTFERKDGVDLINEKTNVNPKNYDGLHNVLDKFKYGNIEGTFKNGSLDFIKISRQKRIEK